MHIAVVSGGQSSERGISLVTAAAVRQALGAGPRAADVLDAEWAADGSWILDGAYMDTAAALGRLRAVDVCFLALHGGAGEDGTVQGWLESAGVPYTGSGVAASALAMDKWSSRILVGALGLTVAPGVLLSREAALSDLPGTLRTLDDLGGESLFLKPRWGGSSLGTFRVSGVPGPERRRELERRLADAFEDAAQLVVERAVLGTEFAVPVRGNSAPEDPRRGVAAWLPVEIVPKGGSFFDHGQKYDAEGAVEHCPPRSIGTGAVGRLQDLAVLAHVGLGCRGISRSDWILPRLGEEFGEPVFLELNTLPGLTPRSLVPLSGRAQGLAFADVVWDIVDLALA